MLKGIGRHMLFSHILVSKKYITIFYRLAIKSEAQWYFALSIVILLSVHVQHANSNGIHMLNITHIKERNGFQIREYIFNVIFLRGSPRILI